MPISPRNDLNRRSVLKTAAWTTPAVVIATSAPAFASSSNSAVELPAGLTTAWRARAQVDGGQNPFVAQMNSAGDDEIRYRVTENGKTVADGVYFTTVTIVLTWNYDVDVTPVIDALNGWAITGSTAPSSTGSLTFSVVLFNGDSLAAIAPKVTMVPVAAAPSSGTLRAITSGTHMGSVESAATL